MSTQQPTYGTADDAEIEKMWAEAQQDISRIDPAIENWKNQSLPLARIKKVMKSEEVILLELDRDRHRLAADEEGLQAAVERASNTKFMISGDAPILMGKACELMIKELTVRAWRHTERNKRKTLQRQDLHAAVGESETYDFLIDLIPRLPASSPPAIPQQMLTNPTAIPQGLVPGGYFAPPGLTQAVPLHAPPGFSYVEGLTAGEAANFVQQAQDPTGLAYQQQQQQQIQQQLQHHHHQQQQMFREPQQQMLQVPQQQLIHETQPQLTNQPQQQLHGPPQLGHQTQQLLHEPPQLAHQPQQLLHEPPHQPQQPLHEPQLVHQPQQQQLHEPQLAHQPQQQLQVQFLGQVADPSAVPAAGGDSQQAQPLDQNDTLWAMESSDGSTTFNDPSSGM